MLPLQRDAPADPDVQPPSAPPMDGYDRVARANLAYVACERSFAKKAPGKAPSTRAAPETLQTIASLLTAELTSSRDSSRLVCSILYAKSC